jgi:predicted patatin/cPLA2 family phospholipase
MRASASMPMVSNVVKIDGYHLLDGAITDSIPLKYFESIGYNKNVVILTQPMGYVKKEISLMPLMRLSLRKYPQAFKALKRRHIMYNDTIRYITEKEKAGEILVIRPEKSLGIGHVEHKSEKLIEVYEEGRRIAEKHIEEIKRFLG